MQQAQQQEGVGMEGQVAAHRSDRMIAGSTARLS